MARWAWLSVLALCVMGETVEQSTWTRSRREHILSRHYQRLASHRRMHRPSTPDRTESRWSQRPSVPETADRRWSPRVSDFETSEHRWSQRPSVPETVQELESDSDSSAQMQQLWEQLMRGTQSDQPQSKLPASALKHQLASRPGVNRLRKLGPKRAFAEFNMMADDASRGARDRDEMLTKMMLDVAKHSCSKPALELVSVAHEHPNPSVSYVPSSVLLARCSDRTGCCGDEVRSCVSKTHVTVELPVLVNVLSGNTGSSFQYLTFRNDTECECLDKKEVAVRTDECPMNLQASDDSDTQGATHRKRHSKQQNRSSKTEKSTGATCQCTGEFAPRILPRGRCKCDCFVGNRKCKRIQRGRVHVSESDNRCIVQGDCKAPVCRYGKYKRTRSRCPRRKGEFRRDRFVV
ncbi:uncharacterized protein LOC122368050 isoform X1 [Amphibalanus amphitrite]|uniref:uncharacterized protein LOC122368050 isoform X1 n=1 Tax=Amphibalanus amphitrite TaxID=1232801 RepID=UPI001C8FDC39|nr:uncharacterized protein LOC122368050 isoform X1 [Amphibalanus amphitrite]